jgi:hypothetical protein
MIFMIVRNFDRNPYSALKYNLSKQRKLPYKSKPKILNVTVKEDSRQKASVKEIGMSRILPGCPRSRAQHPPLL